MTRVLVLGASGQVGTELMRARAPQGWTIIAGARDAFDLERPEALAEAVTLLRPDAIINAAAYTAVDRAESESELAHKLNHQAPSQLAATSHSIGAPIVHLSTDYVFDGTKPEPYVETDSINPLNVYGWSKALGERAVLERCAHAAVLRTSWVYSPHRANFVKAMLRLSETRDEVSVVADQIGRPTAAADIAQACLTMTQYLLESDRRAAGVFHYAGAGETTWSDFAESIFAGAAQRGRKPVNVKRITTAEYPTAARRPANSRLNTAKIEAIGVGMRSWRDALDLCLDELLIS